ncbi:PEP/pyruvate-binding domain-containing protein [Desulfovibrio ferrophilus]|uniref:Phosphoenolpyruvate synthase n=1 Tax=Desulfovibrio ferrophilus TaxID=241368 RepID=A0A2Z6AYC0_9BACT|nr:PEP/pyruvate-binding domain-containing protein [Desulfovibrio ferrophilus]BBD08156.1 pyruvate, water dikinase [Desulfovibrio ferrophilus]
MAIIDAVRKMITRRREAIAEKDRRQMNLFLDKCERFRQLLAANHAALDAMSDMGDALAGLRPMDMNYVRSECVSAVAAVGRMVEALCAMSPDKYDGLRPSLRSIALSMDSIIHTQKKDGSAGPLVLALEDVAGRPDLCGSKTASLAEIQARLGLKIPSGFVFTADAYRLFLGTGLREEIERLCMVMPSDTLKGLYTLSFRISDLIFSAPIPQELEQLAASFLERTPPDVRFAVRSSAMDEDMLGVSFAGQYSSVLNVHPEELFDAFREVVASAYSVTAMTYRRNRGLRDDDTVMCVACMEMIESQAGGVMYTADPLGREINVIQIHAVPGLPVSIVDGACDPDVWCVNSNPLKISSVTIGHKEWIRRSDANQGTCRVRLEGRDCLEPSLNSGQALELANMGRCIEQHFGCPQDVEWALDAEGQLCILQSRPLEILTKNDISLRGVGGEVLLQCGTTASSGIAAGPVHIVNCDADLLSMPRGAVMVTDQAHPAWASALDRVEAIVAGHGSIAGHLANVAREFGVPAIFGIENIIEVLSEQGEAAAEITVDADSCSIYCGVRQELFLNRKPKPILMENSPVMQCLREVTEQIIPLKLTNAKSPDFVPENCSTLHDITRFCHEKGVDEMFNNPVDIPAGSARRLCTDVPTQYWMLDLGGGIAGQTTKAVSIDDIRSEPMLALWQGMHAMPWQGPPPPDAQGFLSVVMEATANPALEAGASNAMGQRNYFMVGSDYCNLQSRFGFHFSTVEGHAGPFTDENYVYLQLMGGGADSKRRKLRASMISNVLARKGFTATAKDDAVFARMENIPAASVLRGMMILGHVIVHTRQLDMAMSDPNAAKQHEHKLLEDISSLLETACTPMGCFPTPADSEPLGVRSGREDSDGVQ